MDFLAPDVQEEYELLSTLIRSGLPQASGTMPSADFCRGVRAPCDVLSHESVTRSRSPEVSSSPFRTQPPDLRFASLMEMGFAVIGPLARRSRLLSGSCP